MASMGRRRALFTLLLSTAFMPLAGVASATAQTSPAFGELAQRTAESADREEATRLAHQLLEMAEGSGKPRELLLAYVQLAVVSCNAGDYQQGVRYADLGLALEEEGHSSPVERQTLLYHRAFSLERLGQTEEALDWGARAYIQARESGIQSVLLRNTQLLANLHGRLGNHSESLRFHMESLDTFGLEDTVARLQVLNNVIVLLVRMGELDRAMAYSDQAEELRRSFPDPTPGLLELSPHLLLNRGNILRLRGEYQEQLRVLEEADELIQGSPDAQVRNLILGALADAHINLGDHARAAAYSRRALAETDPVESPYPHAIALANLGLALSKSGDHAQGLEHLVESRDILDRIGARSESLEVQGLVAAAFEEAGDNAAAVREYKRFKEAGDELRQERLQEQLAGAQADFDVTLAQKEVDLLQAERQVQELVISRQRLTVTLTLVGLVAALVILALGWNRFRIKTQAYDALAIAHEKLDKALEEVKQLQGLLPICAKCKNIRDDQGLWNRIETYISKHSETRFSHTLCPDCIRELYPDLVDELDLE